MNFAVSLRVCIFFSMAWVCSVYHWLIFLHGYVVQQTYCWGFSLLSLSFLSAYKISICGLGHLLCLFKQWLAMTNWIRLCNYKQHKHSLSSLVRQFLCFKIFTIHLSLFLAVSFLFQSFIICSLFHFDLYFKVSIVIFIMCLYLRETWQRRKYTQRYGEGNF